VWLHSILMETKEHWGIFLPIIGTTAAFMTHHNDKKAKQWWILLSILSILLAIMGRMIVQGAGT